MMSRTIDIVPNLHAEIGDDGVAELVVSPEGGMPAMDAQGHAALGSVWAQLADVPEVRCFLVRSVGMGFCAGGTPDLVRGMLGSEAARLRVMREGRTLVQGMIDCDLPIVSAINGAAVGAGAAVALLADVSIADHKAKIIDGHTKLGLAAGDHAALIWPLLCGMARAKYHFLMCSTLDGLEAERIGLVSLAVPDGQLLDKARAVARTLAAGSPTALAFTKRSLNHWPRTAWPAFKHSLALEMLRFARAPTSAARQGATQNLRHKGSPQRSRPGPLGLHLHPQSSLWRARCHRALPRAGPDVATGRAHCAFLYRAPPGARNHLSVVHRYGSRTTADARALRLPIQNRTGFLNKPFMSSARMPITSGWPT